MNLVGRVLILVACVFTAYAFPNVANVGVAEENAMLKGIIAQLQAMNPNYANNSQDSCSVKYSNRIKEINDRTVNETEACFVYANRTMELYNSNVNESLVSVQRSSRYLQGRLANCSYQNSSNAIFECYVNTFDANLGDLYNLTVQSQYALTALAGYEYQVNFERQNCINRVLIENNLESTVATKEFQDCLANSQNGGSSNSTRPKFESLLPYLN